MMHGQKTLKYVAGFTLVRIWPNVESRIYTFHRQNILSFSGRWRADMWLLRRDKVQTEFSFQH